MFWAIWSLDLRQACFGSGSSISETGIFPLLCLSSYGPSSTESWSPCQSFLLGSHSPVSDLLTWTSQDTPWGPQHTWPSSSRGPRRSWASSSCREADPLQVTLLLRADGRSHLCRGSSPGICIHRERWLHGVIRCSSRASSRSVLNGWARPVRRPMGVRSRAAEAGWAVRGALHAGRPGCRDHGPWPLRLLHLFAERKMGWPGTLAIFLAGSRWTLLPRLPGRRSVRKAPQIQPASYSPALAAAHAAAPARSYCPACGRRLQGRRGSQPLGSCGMCEAVVQPEFSFCPECGSLLQTKEPGALYPGPAPG